MFRERVSNDIYVFTSELYARVTAGAIVTSEGVILVDTLPFPDESLAIADFISRLSPNSQRYVILTHYHADHTYGSCFFPKATILSHARCRDLLMRRSGPALEEAKLEEPELEEVSICLPDITFDAGELSLQLGGRVVRLIHAPGHTKDTVMVYVEDVHALFASDTVMPVPSIVDGDVEALRGSLRKVAELPVENMVQGHGEVILRGEVKEIVQVSLDYLDVIEERVTRTIEQGLGKVSLQGSDIEDCGLSRVPLDGLVQQIHVANLLALYDRMAPRKATRRSGSQAQN